jgi:hypothetical protein
MAHNTGDLGEIGAGNGNEKDTRERVSLTKAWLGSEKASKSIVMSRGLLRKFPFQKPMIAALV